jgi:hypothetical protein
VRLVHYGVDPYLDSADRRQTQLDQLLEKGLEIRADAGPSSTVQCFPSGKPYMCHRKSRHVHVR